MATPQQRLAESLTALKMLQDRGVVAIRGAALSRVHRERLMTTGFLREVMKGWYIAASPDEATGKSTAWYSTFWPFCAGYLSERFGDDWCLSPEQSLSLHAGNWAVPRQLLVRTPRGGNKPTSLLYGTSVLDVRTAIPVAEDFDDMSGLRVFNLPAALVASSPAFFENHPTDARAALATIRDASQVLDRLLEGGHSTIAGRLAGAFRNIGRTRIADDIVEAFKATGSLVREQDPFATRLELVLPTRAISPYAGRIRLLWQVMRDDVLSSFPRPPSARKRIATYTKEVNQAYLADAYHSLSIEGYRVSPALIERVQRGNWDPNGDDRDREHRNALAARGYWLAFQAVKKSVDRVLRGDNAGTVADEDHATWYRELFAPAVTAGLLRPSDLAGYRNAPVYISRSMHVPPPHAAVRDAMPALFDMLTEETEPAVRAVLGHFVFVYIHPYLDGNGRIGRFLMNVMLAAGGYPWTIIPVEQRDGYMAALEAASVKSQIGPFTEFLARLVRAGLRGKTVAKLP